MQKKKLFLLASIILLVGTIPFFAMGCGGGGGSGDSATPIVSPTPSPAPTKATWTVLVYLCSDNNLQPFDYQDVKEMEEIGSTEDVNIVIQWDRKNTDSYADWDGCRRYYVKKDEEGSNEIQSELVEEMGNVNMGDPDTLIEFVEWGMENYPADKYAVILWNHGDGWRDRSPVSVVKGICQDDTSGDYLSLPEVHEAFDTIYKDKGKKIDLIGMDACLMGMLEVAYSVKDYGKYIVFSEASEPGSGWAYDGFLRDLADTPSMDGSQLGRSIVESYGEEYSSVSNVTLSCVDLSKIDNVVSKLGTYITKADSCGATDKSKMVICTQDTQNFDASYPSYKDCGNFMKLVGENVEDADTALAAQDVEDAIDDAVVAKHCGSDFIKATGMTIWLPTPSQYDTDEDQYSKTSFAKDTQWDEYLDDILHLSG